MDLNSRKDAPRSKDTVLSCKKKQNECVLYNGWKKWSDPNTFCLRWILAWIWLMRWELRRGPWKGEGKDLRLLRSPSFPSSFRADKESLETVEESAIELLPSCIWDVFGPTLRNPKLESPNAILCLSKTLLHSSFFGMHYEYFYFFGNHRPVLRLCQTFAYTASQQLSLHKKRKPI